METLRQWLRSVVVIIILGGFLEFMLPADDLRRFARMVLNLLLVLALIGPLMQVVRRAPGEVQLPAVVVPEGPSTADLVTAGENLRQKSQGLFLIEGEERLSRRVSDVAGMVPGVRGVQAKVVLDSGGAVGRVEIVIGSAPQDYDTASDAVRRTVSALLEVPPEVIQIRRGPEGGH